MRRYYVDFGKNKEKAEKLYERLCADPRRKPQLFEFHVEALVWYAVYYACL